MPSEKNYRKLNLLLLLILLIAAFLRLWGIKNGFPFIFHPDEPTIIRSALGIRFNPNPKHFDWPHLYIYLNYFLYMIFAKIRGLTVTFGLRDLVAKFIPLVWDENLIYYYLTRCFSALLGAFTVIPVYLTAKNLFGKKTALMGALAFALLPYHVRHSHYALGDVPMIFFLSWGMYFSSLIIKTDNLKNYVLSGFFIGLAASTKYNGGLSALMVPVAHFLRVFNLRRSSDGKTQKMPKILDFRAIFSMFLSGLSAFVGFVLGTPYALLDYKTFSRNDGPQGAFWQFTNVGSLNFIDHIKSFFGDIYGQLSSDTGYTVMAIYVVGFLYLIYRIAKKKLDERTSYLVFFYLVSIFLIWYISGFEKSRSHYYFIFYPFAAIIFGYFTSCIWHKMSERVVFKYISFAVLFSLPALFSFVQSFSFHNGDTRVDLYKWLQSNYRAGDFVVYNDSAVKDVLGRVGINYVKGLDNVKEYSIATVLVLDPGLDEAKFFNKRKDNLTKVKDFDNKLKIGPKIEVYKYEVVKK